MSNGRLSRRAFVYLFIGCLNSFPFPAFSRPLLENQVMGKLLRIPTGANGVFTPIR